MGQDQAHTAVGTGSYCWGARETRSWKCLREEGGAFVLQLCPPLVEDIIFLTLPGQLSVCHKGWKEVLNQEGESRGGCLPVGA